MWSIQRHNYHADTITPLFAQQLYHRQQILKKKMGESDVPGTNLTPSHTRKKCLVNYLQSFSGYFYRVRLLIKFSRTGLALP
jgi:hypothetical protein